MADADRGETDDFLRAKRMLEKGLKLEPDDKLTGMLTAFLRDECAAYKRVALARDVLAAASEKHSPTGWTYTLLEKGNLHEAIAAHGRALAAREQRFSSSRTRKMADVRNALRELYTASEREPPPRGLLDEEGGLSWNAFCVRVPKCERQVRYRLDSWTMGTTRDVEVDGRIYSVVDPPSYDVWLMVLEELLDLVTKDQEHRQETGVYDLLE